MSGRRPWFDTSIRRLLACLRRALQSAVWTECPPKITQPPCGRIRNCNRIPPCELSASRRANPAQRPESFRIKGRNDRAAGPQRRGKIHRAEADQSHDRTEPAEKCASTADPRSIGIRSPCGGKSATSFRMWAFFRITRSNKMFLWCRVWNAGPKSAFVRAWRNCWNSSVWTPENIRGDIRTNFPEGSANVSASRERWPLIRPFC